MKPFRALLFALIASGANWIAAVPAHAQLVGGCRCPALFAPFGPTTCKSIFNNVFTPAICTARNAINQSVGQIAASEQQLSFWGVEMMLQQRRDQLQGPSANRKTNSNISGYAPSEFDSDTEALAYSSQSQKTNPLTSPVYKAPPQPAPASPAWGGWVQGMGNWEKDSPLSIDDIGHRTNTYAVQGGIDRTWQGLSSANDALVAGIVSSWTDSRVSYDNTPTTMRLSGPGVGVYAMYVKGGFSTDLTTKVDFLNMIQDFAGAAPNNTVGITNAGVSGNIQYKITGTGNSFFEPTGGFTFTRTIFGSGASALDLQDSSTLRLQAGARLGTTWEVNGITIDSSLKALVYGNAIVTGTSITASVLGSSVILPTDQGLVRGEVDPSLSFNLADGYSVTLSGSVLFGPAILGGSAALNLRKQF